MGAATDSADAQLVREDLSGSPSAAGATGEVAPPKRRPGRPRKAQPARPPAPEPSTPAESYISDLPPVPQPRATTKDDKAVEAVGQQLGARARQAGEHLSKVSPLAGTTLAAKSEEGAAALARVLNRFFPGLLKAGGAGMILFDVATVLSSLTALGVAALIDAGRLPADHPAAQRMGVTELAAQLVQRQAMMAQQLAAAQQQQMPPQPMSADQYAYLQNQYMIQHQLAQQAQAAAQAQAAQQYAAQVAAQRQQAAAYNAAAGLAFSG